MMRPLENSLYELYLFLGNELFHFGNEEGCDTEGLENGLERLAEIQEAVASLENKHSEAQARIVELESALRHEIDFCVQCSGHGKYLATCGEPGETVVCMRCRPARAALENSNEPR